MGKEVVDLAHRRAQKYLEIGLQLVWKGDFEEAREKFKASTKHYLTADALTYWGWMEFQLGNVEEAIELCEQAIEVDPEFGNPYNDIGSYLVTLGQTDDAIVWFEKALAASRYEARHYPHINLGRIYLQQDLPLKALEEFEKALELAPGDATILDAIQSINRSLN